MGKVNVLELLKEAQATERDLLEEAGYEDQDVKEAHDLAESIKLLYMELGALKEQIEFHKVDLKPFKGLKFNKGKKSILSAIKPGRFYFVTINFDYTVDSDSRVFQDGDVLKRTKTGVKLMASKDGNWSSKHLVNEAYKNVAFDASSTKKDVVLRTVVKEVQAEDIHKFEQWKYISPEFKRHIFKLAGGSYVSGLTGS